jgi:hypothetical protein
MPWSAAIVADFHRGINHLEINPRGLLRWQAGSPGLPPRALWTADYCVTSFQAAVGL